MNLNQILESLRVVQLPMRTKFRGITTREIALFEGPAGWGEFSPFLEYDDRECIPWLKSAIESACDQEAIGLSKKVEVNGILSSVTSKSEISYFLSLQPNVSTFKLKTSKDLFLDLRIIKLVIDLRPNVKIRFDVNGMWDLKQATKNISILERAKVLPYLDYIEQPVSNPLEMKLLKRLIEGKARIAGDEILRKDFLHESEDLNEYCDVIVLKVAPLGGIKRCLELMKLQTLPAVVSSAIDSPIGIYQGVKLASYLPNLWGPCGLNTCALFSDNDLSTLGKKGFLDINQFEHILPKILKYEVTGLIREAWLSRISKVFKLLN